MDVFIAIFQAGGFYSAEDADSYPTEGATEKKEGAFCVWTFDDINKLLSESVENNPELKMADVFCYHFCVKKEGNVDPFQVGYTFCGHFYAHDIQESPFTKHSAFRNQRHCPFSI